MSEESLSGEQLGNETLEDDSLNEQPTQGVMGKVRRRKPGPKPGSKNRPKAQASKPRKQSGGQSRQTKAEKARAWLREREAEYLNVALQLLFGARYGISTVRPDKDRTKHLAAVLKRLERFPPFAALQRLIAVFLPMADPDAKPGGSLSGDLAQYLYGWHEKNPHLAPTIYRMEEKIPEVPFWPKNVPAGGAGGAPPPNGVVRVQTLKAEDLTKETAQ